VGVLGAHPRVRRRGATRALYAVVRRFLALLLIPPSLANCRVPVQCSLVVASEVDINAHLALTPDALSEATFTFCRNAACASGTVGSVLVPDSGTANDGTFDLDGSLPDVSIFLDNELDGYTEVQFYLPIDNVAVANGDTYRVTITDAAGATLIDVSRPAIYDNMETCGTFSKQLRMDLYPTSASGVACSNAVCNAGVDVTGTFDTSDFTTPVHVVLCRDETLCATGSGYLSGLTTSNVQSFSGLDGDFLGSVTLQKSGSAIAYDVHSIEDTAALHDGDVYALTITQGTSTLVSGQATATYTTTFPNGPPCDPVGCHDATLSVH